MNEPIYEVIDGDLEIDTVAEMYALYQMGCTLREIGEEYEISHQTVSRWFKSRGWKLKPQGGGTKTRCRKGHLFTEENTYLVNNGTNKPSQQCKTCRLVWQRANRVRKREAKANEQ